VRSPTHNEPVTDKGDATAGDDACVWLHAPDDGPRRVSLHGDRVVFGRGDHCEVRLPDDRVSWDHLEITRHGETLIATDLDSRNGTLLNGRALKSPTRLGHRDILTVGPFRLDVELRGSPRPPTAGTDARVELSPDERRVAAALVMHYRRSPAGAGRPATKQEIADAVAFSVRTVRRRLDDLAAKLGVSGVEPHERPRVIAERVLAFGLDRD
jgi:predicted component of type VI protein secretion system